METSHHFEDAPQNRAISSDPAGALPERERGGISPRLLGFGVFLLVLTALFARSLFLLFTTAYQSDLNSYIVLIPFVAAYLFYLNRGLLPRDYNSAIIPGALLLLAGAAGLLFVWTTRKTFSLNDHLSLITLAYACFLWAGGFLFLGAKWMRAGAFPMFFLVFLVPLPDQTVSWMETASKLASAEAASLFFALSGTPTFRQGTTFQLPGIVIQVAQECSGIKSSWVLIITSLVAGYLFLKGPWRRLLLVSVVIPLGILRNGFRIMVIGLLCVHVGPDMIDSPIHRRGGPIFFALSLIPLALMLWLLKRGETVAPAPAGSTRKPTLNTGT